MNVSTPPNVRAATVPIKSSLTLSRLDRLDGSLVQRRWWGRTAENWATKAVPRSGIPMLLCANMAGNNVAVFRMDAQTGVLKAVGEPLSVLSPSCIRMLP